MAEFGCTLSSEEFGPRALVEQAVAAERPASTSPSSPTTSTHVDAGYDHVYVHQVGPDQAGFIEFCERELLPQLR